MTNFRERWVIAAILFCTAIFVGIDLSTDYHEGASLWHLGGEAVIAITALIGVVFLMRGSFALKRTLVAEVQKSKHIQAQSEVWRKQVTHYVQGLSEEIDRQLESWKLTPSEKDVALLLLKGLSLKEIAEVRKTSEKTVRAQSTMIYEKSGLTGRSELAAFFLEELLLPRT